MRCMQICFEPVFGKGKQLVKQERRRLPGCPNFWWQTSFQEGQNGFHEFARSVILIGGKPSALLKAASRVFVGAVWRLHHGVEAQKRCINGFSHLFFATGLARHFHPPSSK